MGDHFITACWRLLLDHAYLQVRNSKCGNFLHWTDGENALPSIWCQEYGVISSESKSLTLEQKYDWIQFVCTWNPRVPWERPIKELRNEHPLDMSVAKHHYPFRASLWIRTGFRLTLKGASLQTYQVKSCFEALVEGVLMAPLDSRYTQVGFNLISVQVWLM